MIRALPILLLAVGLWLAACAAPVAQKPAAPPENFRGPFLDQDAFVSFDGTRLGLSTWAPQGEPWAVIVALHGMNDYAAAFHMAGPYWAERGIATYAYDQRGFGRSPDRGVWGGRQLMEEDLRTIVGLVRQKHPRAVIAVAGESMGGAVAISAFASDDPPQADRLVLLAPAVWGWKAQPFVNRLTLWFAAHTFPDRTLSPPRFLTERIYASDNIEELRRMGRDPQMIWRTRPDAIYGLVSLMEHARLNLRKVEAPVAYLYGAHDEIIPEKPSFQTARQLKKTDRSAWYPAGWHILLRDLQAEVVWKDVEGFLRDPSAPLPSGTRTIPGAPTPPN